MSKQTEKDKWIVGQERTDFLPLSPATFILFKILGDPKSGKIIGIPYPGWDIVLEMSNGGGKIWAKEKDFGNFCRLYYNEVKKDRRFLQKLRKKFEELIPSFLEFCERLYKSDLKNQTNKKLWQFYNKYCKIYEKIYPYSEPPAFGSRYGLEKELKEYLKQILKEKAKEKRFNEYFELLITPKEIPFVTKEQINLLKIAVEVKKNPKIKKLFKDNLRNIEKKIKKSPKINKKLEEHEKAFTWVPYNYGARWLTKIDFIKELKQELKHNPEEKLKKIKSKYKKLPEKQEKLIKNLKINKEYKELFEALQTNSFLIDFKKEIFTISHFYFNRSIILEIASRLRLKPEKIHLLLPNEIKEILINNKNPNDYNLDERWDICVVYLNKGNYKLFQGKKAREFLKKKGIIKGKIEDIKEIRGNPASVGKYIGRVKVICGSKKINRLKKGEILVTSMTTPEFTVGMKKAGAIVTNEGGISCHAAIVSRELGIPCIIGTGNATDVLRDGDLIEVDVNKGIIRILERGGK